LESKYQATTGSGRLKQDDNDLPETLSLGGKQQQKKFVCKASRLFDLKKSKSSNIALLACSILMLDFLENDAPCNGNQFSEF